MKKEISLWISLDWKEHLDWTWHLKFKWFMFIISQEWDRAFKVKILLPHIFTLTDIYLNYDFDYEEWYESIDSAKYAVECRLTRELGYDFNS